MAYNMSVHESTGYTPFQLTLERKANLPSVFITTPSLKYEELFQLWKTRHEKYILKAKQRIEKSKLKHKAKQDSKIVIPHNIFEIGDAALLHNLKKSSKLDQQSLGPEIIVAKQNHHNYTILINNERQKIHANRTKGYYE